MNRIGKYLFYAVLLFAVVWTFLALRDLYLFWRLNAQTAGQVQEAHVHELSSSSFDVVAAYTYTWKGQDYAAEAPLGKPYQLNRYSAENEAQRLLGTSRTVYINARHPEISALKREFPYKSVLQAGLTLGICLYLWVLNLYHKSGHMPGQGRRETRH